MTDAPGPSLPSDAFVRLRLTTQDPAQRETTSTIPSTAAFGRSLKVALAMKGGISLAVWIGGAVAELDLLRRIRIVAMPDGSRGAYLVANADGGGMSPHTLARADLYARVMISREFDQVEFDVLAGASAGGLNGILYGVAQRAGADVDKLLSVWVEYGAIWRLLHRAGLESVNSVLNGDFFWAGVNTAINGFYDPSGSNNRHTVKGVSLDLSATIKDPDYRSALARREGRGHFHFIASPDPDTFIAGRDIPTVGETATETGKDSIARLAYAARTTSSFPGAFEPALIWSPTAATARTPSDRFLDMRFAFNAHRDGVTQPFRVIDGGVLDNVPIDRVTRALRERVPDRPSRRVVLYLDPSPDKSELGTARPEPTHPPFARPAAPGRGQARNDPLSRFLGTIKDGFLMRGIRENGDAEIGDLQRYRRSLYLRRGRMDAFGWAVEGELTWQAPARLRKGYRNFRVAADVDHLTEVLVDPDLWQLGTDLPTRFSYEPVSLDLLQNVDRDFLREYLYEPDLFTDIGIGATIVSGSRAALDAAAGALDWLHQVDDLAFWNSAEPVASRASAAARDVARGLLGEATALARRELDRRTDRLLSQLHAGPNPVDASRIANLPRLWLGVERVGANRLAPAWDRIDAAVTILKGLTNTTTAWSTPWARFAASPYVDKLDVGPFAASSGIPDPTFAIQFATITGAEPTPLLESFGALREAQLASTAETWLKRPSWKGFLAAAKITSVPRNLDDDAKLAGATLGNFGAFMSAGWRMNDWWWGRLDAASGIVRIFDALPLESHAAGSEPTVPQPPYALNKRRLRAQALVLKQMNESDDRAIPERIAGDEKDIAAAMTGGAQTLDDLDDGYVVSVMSRLSRVAFRSVVDGKNLLLKGLLGAVLTPLLVLFPLVFSPARAVFALTTVASALQFIWQDSGKPWPGNGPVLILLLVLVLFSTARVREGIRRGSTLASEVDGLEVIAQRLQSSKMRSRRLLGAAWLAWIFVVLLAWLVDKDLIARGWWLVAAAAAAAIAAGSASRSLDPPTHPTRDRIAWLVLTAILVVFSVGISFFFDFDPLPPALPVGGAIAVVAFTLGLGWLSTSGVSSRQKFCRGAWLAIVAIITGVVGGLMIWLITAFFHGNIVFTTPAAATLLAWLASSYVFWILSEVPSYLGPGEPNDRATVR